MSGQVPAAVRGFTLIEMVFLIILISGGAVVMFSLFQQSGKSIAVSEQVGTATQLAQECSEHILARRRKDGYAVVIAAGNTICSGLPAYAGFTPAAVTMTPGAVGVAPCPATATACTTVVVLVDSGGPTLAQTDLLLVN